LAGGAAPPQALVTLGYSGWGEGQLEHELRDNAWLTVPADRAILFNTPLEDRWSAAARLMGVDISRLTDYAGHA
jgi:putative transcriptional regulator